MMDTAAIRTTLGKGLRELNPNGVWPVNLNGILSRLGIGLRCEEKKGRADAHLELGNPPTIVVYRQHSSALLSSKERFSIAHELAHWIVWRRFAFLPSAETYWDHESLCNEFAAALLVPPRTLQLFLERQYRENVDPVYFPDKVRKSAAVSWEVAARSIAALHSADSAYLLLTRVLGSSEKPITFRVKCTTLKNMPGSVVGKNALVRAQQEFLNWMNDLPDRTLKSRPSTLKSGKLDLTNVLCTFLRETGRATDFWIMHFRASDEGVQVEDSY